MNLDDVKTKRNLKVGFFYLLFVFCFFVFLMFVFLLLVFLYCVRVMCKCDMPFALLYKANACHRSNKTQFKPQHTERSSTHKFAVNFAANETECGFWTCRPNTWT